MHVQQHRLTSCLRRESKLTMFKVPSLTILGTSSRSNISPRWNVMHTRRLEAFLGRTETGDEPAAPHKVRDFPLQHLIPLFSYSLHHTPRPSPSNRRLCILTHAFGVIISSTSPLATFLLVDLLTRPLTLPLLQLKVISSVIFHDLTHHPHYSSCVPQPTRSRQTASMVRPMAPMAPTATPMEQILRAVCRGRCRSLYSSLMRPRPPRLHCCHSHALRTAQLKKSLPACRRLPQQHQQVQDH